METEKKKGGKGGKGCGIVFAILLVAFITGTASAQEDVDGRMLPLGQGKWTVGLGVNNQQVKMHKINEFGEIEIEVDNKLTGTAQIRLPAASVVTPAVTYAAALGVLSASRSIIAAGAPTSAFVALPAATANVGKFRTVYNQGSNPVAIVPVSGVINVSAALTPFSCTTLKKCVCEGLTTGVWGCAQY